MSLFALLSAFAVPAAAVALIVLVVVLLKGRRTDDAPADRPGLLEQRLDHLDRLHAVGRISDAERAEARARLLGTV